jgi:hypothetical protein
VRALELALSQELKLRNLEKVEQCYKVTVYEGTNEQYYSFVTPECASFIDAYLEYRSKNGEKLTQDSYLIRDQFEVTDIEQIRNKSRGIQTGTLEVMLNLLLVKAGVRTVDHTGHKRKEVARAHGFRKFFTTQMIKSKVNYENRLTMEGHSLGITDHYARIDVQDNFTEYQKAIDALTINEENRLKKQVKTLQINASRLDSLEQSIKRYTDLKLEQIPHSQGGAYFIGVDIASGSSNTAITVSQRLKDPNVIRILYSEEFIKPSTSQVIDILHRLRLKYGIQYCYFFVDASAAMFCRELCISIGQDPNYDLKTINPDTSYVIPIVWSVEGRRMLSNLEYIINKSYMAINPKHDKLITALKTAYSTDWKLDKERTSYDDSLDSLLLSCRGYKIEPKST